MNFTSMNATAIMKKFEDEGSANDIHDFTLPNNQGEEQAQGFGNVANWPLHAKSVSPIR